MHSHTKLKIALFIASAIVGLAVCFSFQVKKENAPTGIVSIKKGNEQFDESCYTSIKKDTLIKLFNTAYSQAIKINDNKKNIQIIYTTSDQNAPALYNGNSKLLDYELSDYGFKIAKTSTGLDITFACDDNSINVPNDIIIKFVPKN